jgi:hypothetical protein
MGNKTQMVGVHSVAIVDRANGIPDAILKVVDAATIDLSDEIVNVNGSISVPVKEFPEEFTKVLFRNTPTDAAAEATGTVVAPVNKKGTSVVSVAGIASIAATVGGTLLEGRYTIEATAATKIKIHSKSDLGGQVFTDDQNGTATVEYTLVAATPLPITELGITITPDAGAIAMVVGDTAEFTVRRINTGYTEQNIGGVTPGTYKEVWIFFQETTRRDLSYIKFHRCLISKGSWSAALKDFHSIEMTITPTADSAQSNMVGTLYRTKN